MNRVRIAVVAAAILTVGGASFVGAVTFAPETTSRLIGVPSETDRLYDQLSALQGRLAFAEAADVSRKIAELTKAKFGAHSEAYGDTLLSVAFHLTQAHQVDGAEAIVRDALGIFERQHGAEHGKVADALTALARVHLARNEYDAAEQAAQRARTIAANRKEWGGRDVAATRELARIYAAQGRVDDAAAQYKAAIAADVAQGTPDEIVIWPIGHLADLYARHGRYAEAETYARERVAKAERANARRSNPLALALALRQLAVILNAAAKPGEAEPALARAIALTEKAAQDDLRNDVLSDVLQTAATTYAALGRSPDAEAARTRSAQLRATRAN